MTTDKTEDARGASRLHAELDVRFVTDPDEMGRGRVIVNGRYFALPMETVIEYKALRELAEYLRDAIANAEPVTTAANGEVRGASRLAGEASSREAATSTVVLGREED